MHIILLHVYVNKMKENYDQFHIQLWPQQRKNRIYVPTEIATASDNPLALATPSYTLNH